MTTPVLDGLEARLAPYRVPGLQVAVVAGGEVRHAGGVGVRGVADPAPVGPGTVFHHGSCGKAYTGLLACVLAHQGVVDLDAPVRRFLPELELPDPVVAQRVSLRDLLSHRSGLGRHDLVWILDQGISREELVRRLPHLPLGGDFRTVMGYSNLGYTLAGLVLGRATDSTWEEQLETRVLAPGRLLGTTTRHEALLEGPDAGRPHVLRDGEVRTTPLRRFDGAAPAGQLLTTAVGAAAWLRLQLGQGEVDGQRLLPAEAFEECTRVNVGLAGEVGLPGLRALGYAMGWIVATLHGRLVLWHSGGVDGFLTQTLVVPSAGVGVTVSANQSFSGLPLAAALDVVCTLTGAGQGEDWYAAIPPPVPAPTDLPPAPPVGPAPAHPLSAYLGTYAHPGYGELVVSAVEGDLQVLLGTEVLPASHRGYETWDVRYDALDVSYPVTFVTGPEGEPTQAVVPLDSEDPIVFRRPAVRSSA